MKFIVVSVLAVSACTSGLARASESFQTVSQPWHAPGEATLPVAPYAGTGATDSAAAHWSVLVQDITLARTLERWGAQAGYRVKWDAQRNFLIGAPDSVDGTFETALKAILNSAGIRQSDYPLEACIYANTPPLVRITRQGEQTRECDAQ
ncbi:TcpQ domain-containing protein [Scleromatobacter humisilvae]|uniref:Toxin co-regulated pilus biosynthesis Q family protein n=1 Tax=Scleromatobacter humisilvae TaxID=2897159 RepID=A0A9X1YI88_9BURK|nr:TcpQ domain-containing protein [Scleromatobacter humisilvae]MCK9686979.1 toxin co-regulated pilus biosynthesis Q family protein [Scleromatobacter humisilvae]